MPDTKLEFLVVAVGVVLALIGIAAPLVNWGAVGRTVRRAIRHCRRVVRGATDEPNFKVVPLDFVPHIDDFKKLRGMCLGRSDGEAVSIGGGLWRRLTVLELTFIAAEWRRREPKRRDRHHSIDEKRHSWRSPL